MDYEKKYNEALERARKAYNAIPPESRGARKIIEDAFPELLESEDERIRKMCITAVNIAASAGGGLLHHEAKQCLDYLEKQKEQKPELVQQPPITYTYNSNASRDERLKAALLALLNSDLLKVKEGGYFTKQDLIEWVERMPTDKTASWSEEDEKIMQTMIKEGDLKPSEIAWLKSLRPQPRQEWSEEDEEMWMDIKCQMIHGSFIPFDKIEWLENRIKSLRPSWKPSEEQIEALMLAIEGKCPPTSYMSRRLEDLYDGLANAYRIDAKLD